MNRRRALSSVTTTKKAMQMTLGIWWAVQSAGKIKHAEALTHSVLVSIWARYSNANLAQE